MVLRGGTLSFDVGLGKREDLFVVSGVEVWVAGLVCVAGVSHLVGEMLEAGVVRLGDGESSAKGRRGKSEGEDGTSISRNDGGVSEKVNLGGSTLFVVNVRALHNLTVDFREVRLEKSYGTGALDDSEACLRVALSLEGQFCGEDATEEKEGEFPGEYLLRLGVSLSFGLEAGRLGVDSWQGTGP